jgi:hypothetical protein
MKKLLKYSLTTFTGLIVLMFVAAFLISSIGTWLSGGLDQWKAAMDSAAPYLLVWRLIVYMVAAGFWVSTWRMYKAREDAASQDRLKAIGICGLLLIFFVEAPKFLWG